MICILITTGYSKTVKHVYIWVVHNLSTKHKQCLLHLSSKKYCKFLLLQEYLILRFNHFASNPENTKFKRHAEFYQCHLLYTSQKNKSQFLKSVR